MTHGIVTKAFTGKCGWGNGYVLIPKGHKLYGKTADDVNNIFAGIRSQTGLPLFSIADYAGKHMKAVASGTYVYGEKTDAVERVKEYWILGFSASAHNFGRDSLKQLIGEFSKWLDK